MRVTAVRVWRVGGGGAGNPDQIDPVGISKYSFIAPPHGVTWYLGSDPWSLRYFRLLNCIKGSTEWPILLIPPAHLEETVTFTSLCTTFPHLHCPSPGLHETLTMSQRHKHFVSLTQDPRVRHHYYLLSHQTLSSRPPLCSKHHSNASVLTRNKYLFEKFLIAC